MTLEAVPAQLLQNCLFMSHDCSILSFLSLPLKITSVFLSYRKRHTTTLSPTPSSCWMTKSTSRSKCKRNCACMGKETRSKISGWSSSLSFLTSTLRLPAVLTGQPWLLSQLIKFGSRKFTEMLDF